MPSVLFIGGTGLISSECVALAARRGWEVFVLNRGNRAAPQGTTLLVADIADAGQVRAAIAERRFDVVTNFIAYKPEEVARDLEIFAERMGQYVLISSCSCYQKPPTGWRICEKTPLANPFWPYARQKIACEELALRAQRERGIPVTIVRPSLTYGESRIPASYHNSAHSWTTAQRMLTGKPVIVHGDGTGLWQVTHAADFAKGFVGVLGRREAIGEAYNITTDEVVTWNQILLTLAETLGVEAKLAHVATDFIARFDPAKAEGLYGDKCYSVVIDNRKIKQLVPEYAATITLREGLRRTVEWFRADAARQTVDAAMDALTDRIIAANAGAV